LNYSFYFWVNNKQNLFAMQKYKCSVCGHVYDPNEGDPMADVKPGVPFEELPGDWTCPICGAGKEDFDPED
jgi:rubredoxin